MQRLKLPNGSYINPGEVRQLQLKKHFFGKNYYVQILLENGVTIDLSSDVPEIEAKRIRQQYEEQLERLTADISAYKEGKATGLSHGEI